MFDPSLLETTNEIFRTCSQLWPVLPVFLSLTLLSAQSKATTQPVAFLEAGHGPGKESRGLTTRMMLWQTGTKSNARIVILVERPKWNNRERERDRVLMKHYIYIYMIMYV